jgi:Zn finger protein HypA/HybF involved in hydrogenase expression
MSKLTISQKQQLKDLVIDAMVKRLTNSEMTEYVQNKMQITISEDYLRHVKFAIKKDRKQTFEELRKDRDLYINSIFFDRVEELRYMQKVLHQVIETNEDNGDIQIKAVIQLQSITAQLESYYVALPKVSQVESADVNTLFPMNNNTTNNNSSSSVVVVKNNPVRWCERCNREHPLDKEGFRKCPEFKVGMDYEDEPGYYEREDYDDQRQSKHK